MANNQETMLRQLMENKVRIVADQLMANAGFQPPANDFNILKAKSPHALRWVAEACKIIVALDASKPPEPRPANYIPDWVLEETHAIQYNPNCPKPFMVRLVGYLRGQLDLRPYSPAETKDAFGFGMTTEEAALNAKSMREEQRRLYQKKGY